MSYGTTVTIGLVSMLMGAGYIPSWAGSSDRGRGLSPDFSYCRSSGGTGVA